MNQVFFYFKCHFFCLQQNLPLYKCNFRTKSDTFRKIKTFAMIKLCVDKLDPNEDIVSVETEQSRMNLPLHYILSHSRYFLHFFDPEKGKITLDIKNEVSGGNDEIIFTDFISLIKGEDISCAPEDLHSLEMIAAKYKCSKILTSIEEKIVEYKNVCMKSILFHIKNSMSLEYIQGKPELLKDAISLLIDEENVKAVDIKALSNFLDSFSFQMYFEQLKNIIDCYSSYYGKESIELLSHVFNDKLSDDEKEKLVKVFNQFIPFFNKEMKPNKQRKASKKTTVRKVKRKQKPKDYTPDLFDAVMRGSVECVEYLIDEDVDKIKTVDKNGDTPLHYAAKYCQFDVAKTLIKNGADATAKNTKGYTPLHIASSTTKTEIVELLLNSGADPNAKASGGWSPMHDASMLGTPNVIRCLIKHGGDVNITDQSGTTPLSIAGDEEIAEILRESGAK